MPKCNIAALKLARILDEDAALTDERKRELLREADRLLSERSDLLAEQSGLPLPI